MRTTYRAVLCTLLLFVADCHCAARNIQTRIGYDPYSNVDWGLTSRLKAQFHDHLYLTESRYRAYDDAGYDVVSLMSYSGVPSLGYTWTERRWPPEDWLSDELLSSFNNIDFLIPNAEEVGLATHITSPFLTQYIEFFDPAVNPEKLDYHYETQREATRLISEFGGISILAHPWGSPNGYTVDAPAPHAIEVFNAYGTARHELGFLTKDLNEDSVANWDHWLLDNPKLFGVSVNDWFGPWEGEFKEDAPDWVIDSGKTIVLSDSPHAEPFRDAVESGAMLAVRDFGATKDQFPFVESISIAENLIAITTDGDVTWISDGRIAGTGEMFDVSSLPADAVYVRAEIGNADGSIVYTQPWSLQVPEPASQHLELLWLSIVLLHARYSCRICG